VVFSEINKNKDTKLKSGEMWYFYIIIGLLVFFAFTVRVITGFGSGYKLPNEKGGAAF